MFLFLVFIVVALTLGGLFLLFKILANFQPGKNKIQADLKLLRDELANWTSELVPWKADELELLSLHQSNRTVKKGITTVVKGMFTSIYHEPLITYAYKKYVSSGKPNAVLYARTADREFVYRIRNNEIKLSVDGQPIGTVRQGGILYSARTDRLIARINRSSGDNLLPIIVGERELASLPMPSEEQLPTTRAFQYVEESIDENEKLVLLSLAVLELVQRDVPK